LWPFSLGWSSIINLCCGSNLFLDPGNNRAICEGSSTQIGGSPTIDNQLVNSTFSFSWSPSSNISNTLATNPTVNQGGRVFNIVSGSIGTGTAVINTTAAAQTGGALGQFYPDLGIILLNGTSMDDVAGLATGRSTNAFDNNPEKLYNKLVTGQLVQVRREEEISSTNFFCRVPNKQYNFTSNPTFFTGSDGSFTNASFFKDPKVYITQVGLYNDDNELLAIAKLSKPVLKSYSREAIIKVKLDF